MLWICFNMLEKKHRRSLKGLFPKPKAENHKKTITGVRIATRSLSNLLRSGQIRRLATSSGSKGKQGRNQNEGKRTSKHLAKTCHTPLVSKGNMF